MAKDGLISGCGDDAMARFHQRFNWFGANGLDMDICEEKIIKLGRVSDRYRLAFGGNWLNLNGKCKN